jgi:SNF2 family DNA or RNA helicase
MLLLHACWSEGALGIWAEDPGRWPLARPAPAHDADSAGDGVPDHPFAADASSLARVVSSILWPLGPEPNQATLRLPADAAGPLPSPRLAHQSGLAAAVDAAPALRSFRVPTLNIPAEHALGALDLLEEAADPGPGAPPDGAAGAQVIGDSVRYFAAAGRFVRHLIAAQRLVPALAQDSSGELHGVWQPWLADEATRARLGVVLSAMPPICRAPVDRAAHDPWAILDDFLCRTTDALCRQTLVREQLADAIESRNPAADLHVAWLGGLLSPSRTRTDPEGTGLIRASLQQRHDLIRAVRGWIGRLEERGSQTTWRLLLRLSEPVDLTGLRDFDAPGDSIRWTLSFHLQSVERPGVVIDGADIWLLSGAGTTVVGQRIDSPQELLLAELGRAARLYKPLEQALEQADPSELELSTSEAYRFLREVRPLLLEQNIGAEVPEWWNSPTVRLGARLLIQSEGAPAGAELDSRCAPARSDTRLGLHTLVSYQWQLSVGETSLTLQQFQQLAAQHSPLVRVGGRWIEIRPEDVRAAVQFIRDNPGGKIEIGRALRLAYASDARQTGLPIQGMDATGWVATIFGGGAGAAQDHALPFLDPPPNFVGTLRPYQVKGLSWLAFLDRLGLGACLADDMGLGKTIQLLALLAHERRHLEPGAARRPDPTLLVVPMSVIGNWIHETHRFTPSLKVLVHHGLDRLQGRELADAAARHDLVVTTYALAHRDRDQLGAVAWGRLVLDEAQNIKNPAAKQTLAIRSIQAGRRVALTGTPVENRLGELWSIMEFLNPGYLDTPGDFRRRFALAIERYHDRHRAAQLRGLVQPFILRRLKNDASVIADLPEKVESREYCYLTPEQASLYQTCVADMLRAADRAEGIQRRGIVLAGLIKLKQVCNHPGHFLKEHGQEGSPVPDAGRSGKCRRLTEMLHEVIDAGDQALVFTQFRQMGHMLEVMLRHELDREVLFLHGGTSASQREEMIDRFQRGPAAGRPCPVFILSLKAGGLGLNLTAASHVFHFDRWWNPAVEAQATDRAYRIGQTRTVHVHKFVVSGTLEERIDQMIQEKSELAENVIGSGERWLTELSTAQLRDLLTLRMSAVAEEGEDA